MIVIRACVDCRHCKIELVSGPMNVGKHEHHVCRNTIDPVTGEVYSGSARKARGTAGICGREGWLFERRPADDRVA